MTRTVVGLLGWLALVGAVMVSVAAYERRPGAVGMPRGASLVSGPGMRLAMFVHPRCPCSLASITELGRVLEDAPDRGIVACDVWFYRPANEPDRWAHTAAWDRVSKLPGVRARIDPDGVEAERWGALTSGQVVLISDAGRVLFSGGVTGSRGQEGDNPGAAALAAWLSGGTGAPAAPVFGCALFDRVVASAREESRR